MHLEEFKCSPSQDLIFGGKDIYNITVEETVQ